SATITMVPSSVDISCMPVIAKIAMPSTCVVRFGAGRFVDSSEPPPADMGRQPTQTRIRRAQLRSARPITPNSLEVALVDRVLDLLGVRDLIRCVADEQRRTTDDHCHRGDP